MRYPAPSIRSLLFAIIAAASIASSAIAENFVDRHAKNQVAWNEWAPSIAEQARENKKPIFFFVGHFGNSLTRAMANETFANDTIATMVNDTSIPVSVDINEQPELAAFLFQLAESEFDASDWPICIWTDSELAPLAGGGYFPPTDDWGGQGFLSLGRNVSEQWQGDSDNYILSAQERLKRSLSTVTLGEPESHALLKSAIETVTQVQPDVQSLDASAMYSLSRIATQSSEYADQAGKFIEENIEKIVLSAGFDSIAGGFFIGSNDIGWRLPLFQKSAADQSLMIAALANIQKANPNSGYANIIRLTSNFIDAKLKNSSGVSIQFLDSFAKDETMDMLEGSHFLLNKEDLAKLDANTITTWNLDDNGNVSLEVDILEFYHGTNIPFISNWEALSEENDELRNQIIEIRKEKPAPESDQQVYLATNALLAKAYAAIAKSNTDGDAKFENAAAHLKTIESNFMVGEKVFNSSNRKEHASSQAYAYLISAYLDANDVTENPEYLTKASKVLATWKADPRFEAENETAMKISKDISFSITRDADIPGVLGVHIENLQRLAEKTGDSTFETRATDLQSKLPSQIENSPENYLSILATR